MRQITVNLYQFAELSDSAKERARQWYRSVDNFDAEHVISEFVEVAETCGFRFKTREVTLYSGKTRTESRVSYEVGGQCDHASFDATWSASSVDSKACKAIIDNRSKDSEDVRIIEAFLALAAQYPNATGSVSSTRHGWIQIEEFDTQAENDTVADNMRASDTFEALALDLASELARTLSEEYAYQNSDECVDDAIIANEYEFTANGERA